MIANHQLTRAATEKAAISGALALMACGVAALAFALENWWTFPASLSIAAICSWWSIRNIRIVRRHRL